MPHDSPIEAGVKDPVLEAATARFGLRYLFPYQRLVIANILDATAPAKGTDLSEKPSRCACPGREPKEDPDRLRQIVLLPTGYGKSLCFQLPATLIPGLTLVLFPLRSLMADQERRMRERGIPCAVLRGGMTGEDREAEFSDIRSGKTRLVLANPEILRTGAVLSFLRATGVTHAVIDEAHCVAEWGDDFRPAYRDLGDIIRALSPQAVTAFTATASARILERTSAALFGEEPYRVIAGNPDRPNIRYEGAPTLSKNHTLERLARRSPKPILIFCASRAGAEIRAETLMERLNTPDVKYYHAGLTKQERDAVESWFMRSSRGILTATCAYGMGVDKADIRTILHADPPPSVESYLQESGRAGRDGKPALSVLLSHPGDSARLDLLEDPVRRERFQAVLSYGEGVSRCRREHLLSLLGSHSDCCSGCDVCDGTADPVPEGGSEILGFVRANPRRFRAAELPRRLAGSAGPCACSGALSGWKVEDIREAIAALEQAGAVGADSRGLWRGRVREIRRRASRSRR